MYSLETAWESNYDDHLMRHVFLTTIIMLTSDSWSSYSTGHSALYLLSLLSSLGVKMTADVSLFLVFDFEHVLSKAKQDVVLALFFTKWVKIDEDNLWERRFIFHSIHHHHYHSSSCQVTHSRRMTSSSLDLCLMFVYSVGVVGLFSGCGRGYHFIKFPEAVIQFVSLGSNWRPHLGLIVLVWFTWNITQLNMIFLTGKRLTWILSPWPEVGVG